MSDHKDLNQILKKVIKNPSKIKLLKIRKNHLMSNYIDDVIEEKEEEGFLASYVHWTSSDGRIFIPAAPTVNYLKPGVYEIGQSNSIGLYFEKIPVRCEGLLRFPDTNSDRVVTEIQKFWDRENIFKEYGLTYKRGILLYGPPGCHAEGTKVVMHDKTLKNVEDIVVGDCLLGPDKSPRTVLELKRGKDQMYKIVPETGNAFVVNGHHILNLRNTNNFLNENIVLNHLLLFTDEDQKKYRLRKFDNGTEELLNIVSIEHLGFENFYGFTLSDDHLYLTEDFIVHHNSGKSCTIQLIMEDVVNRQGIVIKFTEPDLFIDGMRVLRQIQPDTPVVAIIEDIDSILEIYNESEILNILDGVNEVNKIVFLATTNYPEKLGSRIVNRPSRFDKRFRIGYPSAQSRRMYFENIIGSGDPEILAKKIQELDIDLDRWVEDTDKMSVAHLKELFVQVVIIGDKYEESIETLQSMTEVLEDDEFENSMGFGPVEKSKDFYD